MYIPILTLISPYCIFTSGKISNPLAKIISEICKVKTGTKSGVTSQLKNTERKQIEGVSVR
jgi:hypothetical protein